VELPLELTFLFHLLGTQLLKLILKYHDGPILSFDALLQLCDLDLLEGDFVGHLLPDFTHAVPLGLGDAVLESLLHGLQLRPVDHDLRFKLDVLLLFQS
jgi:hypothetical protein